MRKLQLNTKIYPLIFIKNAVKDYSEYVDIELKIISNEEAQINFLCDKEDLSLIKDEFCNYLIYLIGRE